MVFSVFAKGFFKLVPILAGIVSGYVLSLVMGVVSFAAVEQAAWLALPNFTFPEFNINAILFMIPVAIAPAVEHVGDMLAISNVTNKDYLKNRAYTALSLVTGRDHGRNHAWRATQHHIQ